MSILQRLSTLKTSNEFRLAREEIAKRIGETDDSIEQLKQRLIDAQFSSSTSDRKLIKEEIRTKEELLQDLDAALLGMPARIKAAEAAEEKLELDKIHRSAKGDRQKLQALFVEMDRRATALAAVVEQISALGEALRRANVRFNEAGRKDLKLEHPIDLLKALTGRAEVAWPHKISGYLPAHPDGSAFSRMNEIKL